MVFSFRCFTGRLISVVGVSHGGKRLQCGTSLMKVACPRRYFCQIRCACRSQARILNPILLKLVKIGKVPRSRKAHSIRCIRSSQVGIAGLGFASLELFYFKRLPRMYDPSPAPTDHVFCALFCGVSVLPG